LLPQVQDLGLSLAQIRRQRFDQIQQQADTFPGTLILDAGDIDIPENLINRGASRLATHPVQPKPAGAVCPGEIEQKQSKMFRRCSFGSSATIPFGL
jgi:hypothetical protein